MRIYALERARTQIDNGANAMIHGLLELAAKDEEISTENEHMAVLVSQIRDAAKIRADTLIAVTIAEGASNG